MLWLWIECFIYWLCFLLETKTIKATLQTAKLGYLFSLLTENTAEQRSDLFSISALRCILLTLFFPTARFWLMLTESDPAEHVRAHTASWRSFSATPWWCAGPGGTFVRQQHQFAVAALCGCSRAARLSGHGCTPPLQRTPARTRTQSRAAHRACVLARRHSWPALSRRERSARARWAGRARSRLRTCAVAARGRLPAGAGPALPFLLAGGHHGAGVWLRDRRRGLAAAGPLRVFPARLRRPVEASLLLALRRGRAGAGRWAGRGAGRGAGRLTRVGAGRAWPLGCDWWGERFMRGGLGVPRPRQAAFLEHFSPGGWLRAWACGQGRVRGAARGGAECRLVPIFLPVGVQTLRRDRPNRFRLLREACWQAGGHRGCYRPEQGQPRALWLCCLRSLWTAWALGPCI